MGSGRNERGWRLVLGWVVCAACGGVHLWLGWHDKVLQRDNVAIKSYALSLVEGLPTGSVVLTKGDLTIYPTRYVQACLGVREDVIVMDQEVMGYDWYIPRVRRLHTHIIFPAGVRLRPVGAPGRCSQYGENRECVRYEGVFNLMQFFSKNLAATARGQVFLVDPKSGDHSFEADFRLEPHGMLQRVVPRAAPLPATASEWVTHLQKVLARHVTKVLNASRDFQDPESWEVLVHAEAAEGNHRYIYIYAYVSIYANVCIERYIYMYIYICIYICM